MNRLQNFLSCAESEYPETGREFDSPRRCLVEAKKLEGSDPEKARLFRLLSRYADKQARMRYYYRKEIGLPYRDHPEGSAA